MLLKQRKSNKISHFCNWQVASGKRKIKLCIFKTSEVNNHFVILHSSILLNLKISFNFEASASLHEDESLSLQVLHHGLWWLMFSSCWQTSGECGECWRGWGDAIRGQDCGSGLLDDSGHSAYTDNIHKYAEMGSGLYT